MSFAVLYVAGFLLIAGALGLIAYVLRGNERRWPADPFQWSAVGLAAVVIAFSGVMVGLVVAVQQTGGWSATVGEEADVRSEEMDRPIDDFAFQLVSTGETASFSDLRGQVVLVNIWATWCAPCLYEMPELNRLQADYRNQGLIVLNLSDESREDLLTYQLELPLQTMSAYVDPADVPEPFRRNFQVRPTSFIVDREGRLRASALGARSYDQFLALLAPYMEPTLAGANR